MTEPQEFPPVSPSPEEGPGPTVTVNEDGEVTPDFTRADGPELDQRRRPNFKLGQNKKPRSGVRALNKQDAERLTNWYLGFALMLAPLNRNASKAIADNVDQCVDAWLDLAAQNDNVRRFLLSILEGGAWSKVIGAHMPILYAAVPPDVWVRIPGLSSFTPIVEETE